MYFPRYEWEWLVVANVFFNKKKINENIRHENNEVTEINEQRDEQKPLLGIQLWK